MWIQKKDKYRYKRERDMEVELYVDDVVLIMVAFTLPASKAPWSPDDSMHTIVLCKFKA